MRFIVLLFLCLSIQTIAQPITIGKSYQLNSKILNQKRTINVCLPPEYDSTKAFPVIYLLDGGMDEDFLHVCGLVQYVSRPWINYLPPTIVVGIASIDRKRDFTPPAIDTAYHRIIPQSGGAKNFMEFLEKELKPYISKNFHVNDSSTLIGESLGGLMATQVLLNKPDLFSHYVIVSPSLWWNNFELRNQPLKKPSLKKRVFIAAEHGGPVPGPRYSTMAIDAFKLHENLMTSPLYESTRINMSQETHATILHPALMSVFKNWNTHDDDLNDVVMFGAVQYEFTPTQVKQMVRKLFEKEDIHLSQQQLSLRTEVVGIRDPSLTWDSDSVLASMTFLLEAIEGNKEMEEASKRKFDKRMPGELVHDKEKISYVAFYNKYEQILKQDVDAQLARIVSPHSKLDLTPIKNAWDRRDALPNYLLMEVYMTPVEWKEAQKMFANRRFVDTAAQRILDQLMFEEHEELMQDLNLGSKDDQILETVKPFVDPERLAFIRDMNLMLLHGKRLKRELYRQ